MTPVVSVRDLRLRRGTRDILHGVTFDVARGEIVALMGLSGSGKTTILRVIAGLETESSILVARGAPPPLARAPALDDSLSSRGAAGAALTFAGSAGGPRTVGMVFQFHFLFEHLTVLDNVCLAPVHVQRVSRRVAETRARGLLADLGIGHRARALPRELSGGEAQRAAIARALAMDPPLLLLDEPTASLDPARRTSLGLTLGELGASGRAILVTSHDVDFVRDHATRVLILAEGRVVEAGDPRTVLGQPAHAATRALLQTR